MSKRQARLRILGIVGWLGAYAGCLLFAGQLDYSLLGALALALPLTVAIPFGAFLCCFLGWRLLQLCYYGPPLLFRLLRRLTAALARLISAAISGPDEPQDDSGGEESDKAGPGPLSRPSGLAERTA